ncbi:phosphocholine cytidylyltransferase family protein [Lysinibacillus sp. TE18511]
MSIIKHAIISAAGMGTRLGMNMPKCLVEVNGRKIIDYLLELLKNIEDIRIVVGFMEEEVINYVKSIRSDVIFVRNPNFKITTNSYSVHLASKDLDEPFLIIDGDLIINKKSFENFLSNCEKKPEHSLVGITKSKTEEAVFTAIKKEDNENYIKSFTREEQLDYEWSGLAYLNGIKIEKNGGYIFHELEKHLPIRCEIIECWEIDTPEDLENACLSCY